MRNELIVQNVRPMIESPPLLEAPNGYARMMSGAARLRMVLVTGTSKGDSPMNTSTTSNQRRDLYTRVTERVVADLERGARPWPKP